MKKFIFSIVMMLTAVLGVSAQCQDEVPVFNQNNFSLGVYGGVQTNLYDWNAPQGAVAGVNVNYQFNPVFGITGEVGTGINNQRNWYANGVHISGYAFDQLYVFFDTRYNLMNAFGGYTGKARFFEIEPVVGVGYGHGFKKDGYDAVNTILGKVAINFNFNVAKDWTVNVTPAMLVNFRGAEGDLVNMKSSVGQITAGVTYHFNNYNGGTASPMRYTQCEVDALNAEINALRARTPEVVEKVVEREVVRVDTVYVKVADNTVGFTVNSARLPKYVPTLDAIAASADENTVVTVTGYASVEGAESYNKSLSERRAVAVRDYIVRKGVNPDNVKVVANGATDQFGTDVRDYNRVVVVTF